MFDCGGTFHASFTAADLEVLVTAAVDAIHRDHPVMEQLHDDLNNSALVHLPYRMFTVNTA